MDSKRPDFKHWQGIGEKWERALARYIDSLGWRLTRNDGDSWGNPDFALTLCFDLKAHFEPFRKSLSIIGIPPSEAVAVNTHKIRDYAQAGALVLFLVDFRPLYDTFGLYLISGIKLLQMLRKHPERCFSLKTRADKFYRSKETFHVSIKECLRLPDAFFEGVRACAE